MKISFKNIKEFAVDNHFVRLLPLLLLVLFNESCRYDHGFLAADFLPQNLFFSKISTYGIMMALGFITASFLLQPEFKRLNYDVKIADNLIIIIAIGGIVGAKVFFVWESSAQWQGWDGFSHALFDRGGLTWYGGFIMAMAFSYVYLKIKKIPFVKMLDVGTPLMAMGYVFGRMGCLVSGDGCYGIAAPASWPFPFAMAFPNGAAPWEDIIKMYNDVNVRVYNTPLFEALLSLTLFSVFYVIRKKDWPAAGLKFATFVFFHSTFRFLVEFIRLNPRDVFGVSQAQFISILMVCGAVFYYIYKSKEIFTKTKGKGA
ncbi:MAG: prolipoprotein diacylglyceryl transferase [Spirochaetia bacterium]|nr:prolipoprotein diacylglyceryl transferase [Spirochaetia bacterium]